MKITDSLHNREVARISRELKRFYKQKKRVRVYHGTTNSTRAQAFKKNEIIDISSLNKVLFIDQKRRYAIVEPNVPMDALVKETLKSGFIPPVVMEFPGITVGGGIQGGAGESSSFKWGGFHETCTEHQIALGDGSVKIISPSLSSDLFRATPCSYGTLGIICASKLQLIPAKKFVLLTYYRVRNFKQAVALIEKYAKENVDFIDGILFSKNLGTVMIGKRVDSGSLPITGFTKATDDWFYTHAHKVTKKHNIWHELVPLQDYLFRYDRGGFWVGRYPFTKTKIPFNRVSRFLLNPLLHTRTLYRFLQAINISQRFYIQDFCMPKKTTLKFLEYIHDTTAIYPIWLCPFRVEKEEKLSPAFLKTDLVIDVGVWGKVSIAFDDFVKLNRDIEKKVDRLGGRKIFYAHSYYTEKEFWNIYDKKWYETMRKKYRAGFSFPDVYEKTKVSKKYEVSVLKGLFDIFTSPLRLRVSK